MKNNSSPKRGWSHPRLLLALTLCSGGALLAFSGVTGVGWRSAAGSATAQIHGGASAPEPERYMPGPGGEPEDLEAMELDWHNRLTYPTGRFDPSWVRQAAAQNSRLSLGVPAGVRRVDLNKTDSVLTLNPNGFTSLGPKPLRMTGCSGCFDYQLTAGRINDITVDPTTTTNGTIVAYAGSVGGGVWKT